MAVFDIFSGSGIDVFQFALSLSMGFTVGGELLFLYVLEASVFGADIGIDGGGLLASLGMAGTKSGFKRKMYLVFSLCSNLGILFSFKYFNFFNDSLRAVMEHFPVSYDVPSLNVLLPVGISFILFRL